MDDIKQQGFSVLGALVLLVVGSIVGYLVAKSGSQPEPTPVDQSVGCAEDAKLCPDGSVVIRVPPTCEFKSCPRDAADTSSWQTYRNEEHGFEIKIPPDWVAYNQNTYIEFESEAMHELRENVEQWCLQEDPRCPNTEGSAQPMTFDTRSYSSQANDAKIKTMQIHGIEFITYKTGDGFEETDNYETTRDKKVFHFIFGDAGYSQSILSTFKFIK